MPPHNFCVPAFTPVIPPLRSNEKSTRLSLCAYIHSHRNVLDVVTPHEGLMKLHTNKMIRIRGESKGQN